MQLVIFPGNEVCKSVAGVFLHRKKYAEDIIKKFRMRNCNPAITPMETGAKLSKDTNDEPVNATLYKSQTWIMELLRKF